MNSTAQHSLSPLVQYNQVNHLVFYIQFMEKRVLLSGD